MEKRILNYIKRMNNILNEADPSTDWNEVLSEHLNQISFFQHERLVHLIVTIAFGFFLVMMAAILLLTNESNLYVFILFFIITVTLIFYIRHYYYLENGVQKLYKQYDEILLKRASTRI